MKKSYHLISFLIIILFSVFLTGCQTAKYITTDSPVLQTDEFGGIGIQCLYLDKEAINKRHGYKNNPFVAPPMTFTPMPIIIFEITIKNTETSPVKIDSRDIEFYYSDKSYSPMSKVQMEDKIDENTKKGTDKIKQKRIARAYMLGDIRTIPGNSEVKGYLVFMRSFKDRGEGELILPFKSSADIEICDFSFFYNFKMKR